MTTAIINKGDRYGKLTIIKEVEPRFTASGRKVRQFLCQCDCGNTTIAGLNTLREDKKTACGCTRGGNPKHKLSHTRLYHIWHGMNRRCTNPNADHYKYYGGRGITVCEEWKEFEAFYRWANSNGYSDELSLDKLIMMVIMNHLIVAGQQIKNKRIIQDLTE